MATSDNRRQADQTLHCCIVARAVAKAACLKRQHSIHGSNVCDYLAVGACL